MTTSDSKSLERRRDKLRVAIGLAIRNMRMNRGLRQRELGSLVGAGEVTQCMREQGKRQIAAEDLILYAEALRVSPSTLLRDTSQ